MSTRDWTPKVSSAMCCFQEQLLILQFYCVLLQITTDGGYLGDKYPLCTDLPERHFLKQGATYRLLAGSSTPLWHSDPSTWNNDPEIHRMTLHPSSPLYNRLCKPTNAPLPSSTLLSGNGIAQYDATLTAPLCRGRSSSCDSNMLLDGRVNEINGPNTIDSCVDGADTATNVPDYSVKRIVVSSVDGNDLRGGDIVRIQATVHASSVRDRVDFYFSANANTMNPNWHFITTVSPVLGVSNVTVPYSTYPDVTYSLPKCSSESGCKQAVR